MIRRNTSLLSLLSLHLAGATLLGVACAPASGAPPGNTGGVTGNTGGVTGNTGGFTTTTGGFTTTTGGFATTGGISGNTGGFTGTTGGTTGTTGGTTGTTGGTTATTGGTTGTTGGTTATTGGTATATGGSGGAASCNTYNGTLGTSGASKIFMDGFGTATTGMWKGYAYTYTYGTGAVIKPATGTMECFKGTQLCAAGSVPAADSAGIGVGWNINQASGTSTTGTAVVTSVKFVLAGAKEKMRVALGGVMTGDEYCYTLTAADATAANSAAGLTLTGDKFAKECYDTAKATAYAGSEIKSIQVGVPGAAAAASTFDFCIVDIEPG